MNALSDPFKQLVERRLWPLALLLVAALVAVPILLAEEPEETGPLPLATTAGVPAGQGDTEAVVSLADASRTDKLRAVLGNRKDPFRPAQLHRVQEDEVLTQNAGQATVVDGGGSSGGSTAPVTGTTGGDIPATPTETPVATPTPKAPTYELYSLEVRFGPTDGELVSRNVKRLTGLPGGMNPALLYLGLTEDREKAVFMVDAGVEVLGDGECDPTPDNCQTLTLEKGEIEFVTRGDEQWELDLIDIHVKRTDDAAAARRARAAQARNGRKLARRMGARASAYRYDAGRGTLQRVAKTSRRAQRSAASDANG